MKKDLKGHKVTLLCYREVAGFFVSLLTFFRTTINFILIKNVSSSTSHKKNSVIREFKKTRGFLII